MTPTEWNQFILVAIVGVPFAVVFGGPFAWRALVMLLVSCLANIDYYLSCN